jgi:uncharacterized protein (TIGR00369 family)
MEEDILARINKFCENTLVQNLGIEFIEYSGDRIVARMPVDERTMRPGRMLHGGASMALAETVGSCLSFMSVPEDEYNVFGIEINGNHISSVKGGYVTATADFIHKGKTTQVVGINIVDEDNKNVSACRITNIILPKKR